MNVERVRSFEAEPGDPARERANGKLSGFSALMDSVLGPAKDAPSAATVAREARSEKAPQPRETRPATPAPRKPSRQEGRDEETGASAVSDARSARSDEEVVESETKGDTQDDGSEDTARAVEGEVLAGASPPVWAYAVAMAVPVLEGLAPADEAGAVLPAEEVVEGVEGIAAADDSAYEGLLGTVTAQEEGELAEATNGRSVIADPKARAGFLAALEEAQTAPAQKAVAPDGDAAPVEEPSSAVAPEVLVERSVPISLRTAPRTEMAARVEIEGAAIRSGTGPNVATPAQTDLGSDDFSRGRQGDSPQPVAMPAERASSEAGPVVAAAIEGASAGLAETAPTSAETSAALRLDGAAPNVPARATELPPALQTGRSLPTTAPDAIAVQADWLASRGGGTARLVLNPPELGEIAIRVSVRQQSVEVVMVAQTALAHAMAEDQGDRLSQAFASRDLRLEQFEVRRGDPSDSSGTGQFGSSDAGARERERAQQEREVAGGGFAGRGLGRNGDGGPAITPPPRVAPNGRAAGIDLRI